MNYTSIILTMLPSIIIMRYLSGNPEVEIHQSRMIVDTIVCEICATSGSDKKKHPHHNSDYIYVCRNNLCGESFKKQSTMYKHSKLFCSKAKIPVQVVQTILVPPGEKLPTVHSKNIKPQIPTKSTLSQDSSLQTIGIHMYKNTDITQYYIRTSLHSQTVTITNNGFLNCSEVGS